MSSQGEIFCVDPGLKTVDHEACLEMAELAHSNSFSFSHHLPAVKGMRSIYEREKVVNISGIIVMGSVASVNGGDAWQEEFHPWLEKKTRQSTPTLGICYGHQLIAALFGGRIDYMSSSREKFFGFRSFQVLENCPLKLASEVEVVASHEEEIKELPECFQVCASSKRVRVDGFCHKSLPIVCFQSHPEARGDFCHERGISYKSLEDPFAGGRSVMKAFMEYVKTLDS